MQSNISLVLILVVFLSSCQSNSHLTKPQLTPDPTMITGTLDSGLKYSLLPNDTKDLAILLQIHTGSLAETDEQQGYAHLIEHLAFQGTEHFNAEQINQLYSDTGMQLGPDINAFTHFDTTQFVITLSQKNNNLTTVTPFIKWLGDVAAGKFVINSDKLTIEKEIVLAEGVRLKQNPKPHFSELFNKHLLQKTKRSQRMPIGKAQNIINADIAQLTAFIVQHYHLANSSLVIIGKGADEYQALIEKTFNNDQVATNILTLPVELVNLNTDNFFFKAPYADEFSQLMLYHPPLDQTKTISKQHQFLSHVFEDVIYNRLRRASTTVSLPFTNISVENPWLYDIDNSALIIQHNHTQHAAAIKLITTELRRLIDFGLLTAEYNQLQNNWLDKLNHQKPPKARNEIFVLAKTHLENTAYSGFEADIDMAITSLKQLDLASFNQKLAQWLTKSARQWAFSGSDLAPTILLSQISAAKQQLVLAPSEQKLPSLPTVMYPAGSVIDEQQHTAAGITQWTLSNGIKVIMQPRPSKSVSMLFIAPGGLSAVAEADYPAAVMAAAVYSRSGQHWIADTDLEKLLIDNKIDLYAVMQQGFQGLEIKASPEKLPLAFALIHSSMNNAVVKKSTFAAIKQQYVAEQLKGDKLPVNHYSRKLSRARLSSTQDFLMPTAEQYKAVNIAQLESLYAHKYQNAQDYVLAISGEFSIDNIRPFIEKQIASLNTGNPANARINRNNPFVLPSSELTANSINDAQKAHINYAFFSPVEQLSIKERFKLVLLGITLRETLFNTLRKEQGLVYDVNVPLQYSDSTIPYHFLAIMAVSDPLKVDAVIQGIAKSIQQLRSTGINQTQLEHAKQLLTKSINTDLKDDYTMTYILASNDVIDLDYMQVINFEKQLQQIDILELNKAIDLYLAEQGKHVGIFYQ